MFLTRLHDRFLPTGLAHLHGLSEHPLRHPETAYQHALDDLARDNGLAA